MRRHLRIGIVVVSGLLLCLAGGVFATTHHGITIDGNLADFLPDETIEADQLGDSIYGTNNDLSTLYVTWDAQKLYLGFAYKAEQTAVMLLVETGKTGGVTSFCSPSYGGAFPANLQGPDFDLMLAFFAPADHGISPSPYLYTLASNGSTDVSASSGVAIKLSETVSTLGRDGRVEAAIPWELLYGLGAGKVAAGAKLQIALAVRGKLDNDGIGDVSPDPGGGVKTGACGSTATLIDKLHVVTVDANGDGSPEVGWSPASNGPSVKPDGGVDGTPTPDQSKPSGDLKGPDQATAKSDTGGLSPDGPAHDRGASAADQGSAEDGGGADRKLGGDKKLAADTGKRPANQDEGCACALGARERAPTGSLLAFLLLALFHRRRLGRSDRAR